MEYESQPKLCWLQGKETQPSLYKSCKDIEMPLNKFQPVLNGTELETGSHQREGSFSVSLERHNPSPAFLCACFILYPSTYLILIAHSSYIL